MGSGSSVDSHYDTVIIGCGMAGLAAGIRLAMFDRKVLIVERHNAPGGLNSFYFLHGRKFDVGLHAVTNFSSAEQKGTPFAKLLRQLRLTRDDFKLAPQRGSRIAFEQAELRFTNDFSVLEQEVAQRFPACVDGFRLLRAAVLAANPFDLGAAPVSARKVVSGFVRDPLLEDMIFCPLMYYGSSSEHDMDWGQFVIMWKALFEEGFGRPLEGVRVVIRALTNRYRELGGERRMRCGVRRILVSNGRAAGVELDDGAIISADHVVSTAGWTETLRMCPDQAPEAGAENVGRLSFVETITVLDRQPEDLGCNDTIIFFNSAPRFNYCQPTQEVDLRSGVICFPNNYCYPDGAQLPEGLLRVTAMARYEAWATLEDNEYRARKQFWFDQLLDVAVSFLPSVDSATLKSHTLATDMFTPRTITRFTGHLQGAIYGSTQKQKTGRTHLPNLYLAGTDQGFLGITGAMLSGISMANMHILQARQASH